MTAGVTIRIGPDTARSQTKLVDATPSTTTFTDGHQITEKWDGLDRRAIYTYDRASRVAHVQVDPRRVLLEVLDDAGPEGWDAARSGANARVATQDSTAIAYLGELDSGATRISLPITNQAGIARGYLPPDRVVPIYNGVDFSRFDPDRVPRGAFRAMRGR